MPRNEPPLRGWLPVFLTLSKNMFTLQKQYILTEIKSSNNTKRYEFFMKSDPVTSLTLPAQLPALSIVTDLVLPATPSPVPW